MVISRCHCVQAGPTGLRWYSPENGGSLTSKNGWSLASKPHTNQRGTVETGEFTWGLGLNEPHPRGQFNAFLAAAEAAGPGAWEALSAAPLEPCPQIVGVDFPTMAFDRAEWIGSSLYLGLAPLYENPSVYTTFRIVGVEPRQWDIAGIDGAMVDARADGVVVRVPLKKTLMTFTPSSY